MTSINHYKYIFFFLVEFKNPFLYLYIFFRTEFTCRYHFTWIFPGRYTIDLIFLIYNPPCINNYTIMGAPGLQFPPFKSDRLCGFTRDIYLFNTVIHLDPLIFH